MWLDVGLGMLLARKSRDKIRTLHAWCLMCDGVYNMSCMLCELCDHVLHGLLCMLCICMLGE